MSKRSRHREPSGAVHVDDLPADARARVMAQVDPDNFNDLLPATMSKIKKRKEPRNILGSMSNDKLAKVVIAGCVQFKKILPYVAELRARFAALPRGR